MKDWFDSKARSVARSPLDDSDLLSGHWAELQTFLIVAKAGSITQAAEKTGASRTTINRQIRRLQDVVGAQLLVSSASGIALTDKGNEFAQALARIDHDLFAATRHLAMPKGSIEGVVRISCPDGLGLMVITPALTEFSAQYPGIQLHLSALYNYRYLRENLTDCMITIGPDEQRDVVNVALGWLHLAPVASRSYIAARGVPTEANLNDHDFLDSEKYSASVPLWIGWQDLIRRGRVRHFADNAIIYGMMVKAGLGIGLLASYTFHEPSVAHIPLGVEIHLPIYAAFLADRLQDRSVAAVREFLIALFATQPWFERDFRTDISHVHPGLRLFLS